MTIFPDTPGGPFFPPRPVAGMPVGSVIAYAGSLTPPGSQGPGTAVVLQAQGWMLCDGRTVDASEYPELFAALGYGYGGANGRFQLPDYRGEPLAGAGPAQAPAVPRPANYLIKFTDGLAGTAQLPGPPLAAMAAVGNALADQDRSTPGTLAGAADHAGAMSAEPAPAIAGGPAGAGQTVTLVWHAVQAYAFTFDLVYGQDGRFEALRCYIHSTGVHFPQDGYLLPLSLKTEDAARQPVEISMALAGGQAPWGRSVRCLITVPHFRFEGIAFQFSEDVDGPPPFTIW